MGLGIWLWQASTSEKLVGNAVEELEPEITVVSGKITDFSERRLALESTIVLKNPYPFALRTYKLDYQVYIDSIKVIEDPYLEPIQIRASDSTTIEIPMEILLDEMQQVYSYFEKQDIDSADYRLKASFKVDVPVAGRDQFEMEFSKKMPAMRKMEVYLQSMDANMLSSDDEIEVVIMVSNPNKYPIRIEDSSFRFVLEEDLEVVGSLKEVVNIPAQGSEKINIMAKEQSSSLSQGGLEVLFDQEGTKFTYFFSGILSSENKMLNAIDLQLRVDGTLEELSDVISL